VIVGLVLHDPGTDVEYVDVLARAMMSAPTSYHELIGPSKRTGDQEVHVIVPHCGVAWHADARYKPGSTPWGAGLVNEHTIGLCVVNPGTSADVATMFHRACDLCVTYGIPPGRIYAHREVSYSRTDARPVVDMDAFRADVARWLEPGNS